jgi:hypothetical protein
MVDQPQPPYPSLIKPLLHYVLALVEITPVNGTAHREHRSVTARGFVVKCVV